MINTIRRHQFDGLSSTSIYCLADKSTKVSRQTDLSLKVLSHISTLYHKSRQSDGKVLLPVAASTLLSLALLPFSV